MVPGARSKFGAPIFESEAFRKLMHWIEESSCDIVGTFCAHSTRGELCPLAPRYAAAW